MNSRNNKQKNRAHRKFVRAQKQLLRRRRSKSKPRKWVYIKLTLDLDVIEKLKEYARTNGISVNTAISRCLKAKMKEERWDLERT